MEIIAFILVGLLLGLLIGRMFDVIFSAHQPRGRWCVVFHNKEKKTYSAATLAYQANEEDKFVAIKLYDARLDTFREIPMFISRDKVRFYHDDGEPIRKDNIDRFAN
jgi:hypothetical protein